jgi:hypothetical protein
MSLLDDLIGAATTALNALEAALDLLDNGGNMATQEEIKNAISEGMEAFTETLAKRYLSGAKLNFSVDDEGHVVIGGGDDAGVDLPEDDPETVLHEELSAKSGGMIAVRLGFQQMLKKLDGFFAAAMTDVVAQGYMESLFQIGDSPALLLAIQHYFSYRASNGAYTIPTSLDSSFFCKGLTLGTMSEWALSVPPAALDDCFINLYKSLEQAQLNEWFDKGKSVPSTAYQSYSCTKIKTETFQLDMSTSNAPSYVTNGVWKAGHRYLIEAEGSYSDSDAAHVIGDAMYFHNTTTGAKTFSTLNFNFDGSISVPSQALVPFSADHKYAFTIERNVGAGDASRSISRDNGSDMNLPNVTGIISIKISDLGEFAL